VFATSWFGLRSGGGGSPRPAPRVFALCSVGSGLVDGFFELTHTEADVACNIVQTNFGKQLCSQFVEKQLHPRMVVPRRQSAERVELNHHATGSVRGLLQAEPLIANRQHFRTPFRK
jgi:hypothetical protein